MTARKRIKRLKRLKGAAGGGRNFFKHGHVPSIERDILEILLILI